MSGSGGARGAFDGSTVLVTGAGSGIGLALARELSARGARVLACGRERAKLEAARTTVPRFEYRLADLREPSQVASLAEWARNEAADGLVNNAGILVRAPSDLLARMDDEIATNLAAPMRLTALLLDHLRSRERAFVLMVGSTFALAPVGSAAVHSATKAGLHAFTQALRGRLAGTGVRVIEALPPPTDTPSAAAAFPELPKTPPEDVAREIVRGIDRGRDEILIGRSRSLARATRAALGLIVPTSTKMQE